MLNVFGSQLTWEEWMGSNRNGDLYYQGIIFEFHDRNVDDPTSATLTAISCECREDVYFRGRPLVSWKCHDIQRELELEDQPFTVTTEEICVPAWNLEFVINEYGICEGFYMCVPRRLHVEPSDTELEIEHQAIHWGPVQFVSLSLAALLVGTMIALTIAAIILG